ncbi:unnamed protein product [Heligmosomoides polygyrus]|uniref:Peptidase_M13 domain-containing protein n=1 Tax=Heligmosomoides polygyrus TaxID=6339 RepID=A0A183GBX0_HELPZ|nr:unnamed protein product [Heligmosomoides polygyrus]
MIVIIPNDAFFSRSGYVYVKSKENRDNVVKDVKTMTRYITMTFAHKYCRSNFLQSPAMVNAWYQPERNSITFPYAIWNPPYYNIDYPKAYNFGGQGGTGGHELVHGFDDEGQLQRNTSRERR